MIVRRNRTVTFNLNTSLQISVEDNLDADSAVFKTQKQFLSWKYNRACWQLNTTQIKMQASQQLSRSCNQCETPCIAVETHKEAMLPALRYMQSRPMVLVIINIVEEQRRCSGRIAKGYGLNVGQHYLELNFLRICINVLGVLGYLFQYTLVSIFILV